MRGISGIGLLLCLFIPFMCAWQILTTQIHRTKKEVTESIGEGKFEEQKVLLKFTEADSADLYWEHSREFQYKGEMYDVISAEKYGDTIFYWCYHDIKETSLKKERNGLLTGQFPFQNNSQTHHRISDFFKTLYTTPFHLWRLNDPEAEPVKAHINYCYPLRTHTPCPPSPPPDPTSFIS